MWQLCQFALLYYYSQTRDLQNQDELGSERADRGRDEKARGVGMNDEIEGVGQRRNKAYIRQLHLKIRRIK